MLEAGDMILET